jgi:hypothetical protein
MNAIDKIVQSALKRLLIYEMFSEEKSEGKQTMTMQDLWRPSEG